MISTIISGVKVEIDKGRSKLWASVVFSCGALSWHLPEIEVNNLIEMERRIRRREPHNTFPVLDSTLDLNFTDVDFSLVDLNTQMRVRFDANACLQLADLIRVAVGDIRESTPS